MNEVKQHLKSIKKLDDELEHLKSAYKRTENKWLYVHLFIVFPFLELFRVVFHGLMKKSEKWKNTDDKFPILQFLLVVFNGSVIWGFFKGVESGSFIGKYISLLKDVPSDILIIGIAIIWYISTVVSIRMKATNPRSAYFLWRAYRKWDHHYKWNGYYIENFSTIKLIEDAISIIESQSMEVITPQEVEGLVAYMQDLNTRLVEDSKVIDFFIEMNGRLIEIILKNNDLEFKHLNLMDMPFALYKKVGNSLKFRYEERMREEVSDNISLNETNLYTYVYRRDNKPVIKDGKVGFKIKARDLTEWVIVFKPRNIQDFELLKNYRAIIPTELYTVLKTLITRLSLQ